MKRGFTLVELLAVIGVLSVLTLIAIPTIDSIIKKNRERLYQSQILTIKNGMKTWATSNVEALPENEGDVLTLDLGFFKASGFIDSKITNPITGKCFSNDMILMIRKISNNYEYIVDEDSGSDNANDCRVLLPDDGNTIYAFFMGSESMSINVGQEFKDPGIRIIDKSGDKITTEITLEMTDFLGNVITKIDTSKINSYILKYNYKVLKENIITKSGSLIRYLYIESDVDNNIPYIENTLNGTDPVLDNNMIPVYYLNNTIRKANLNSKWYDYSNKMWANAVLVKDDKKDFYKNSTSGTIINQEDIIGHLVWIPRYKYAIPTGVGAREIKVIFENKNISKSLGTAIDEDYYTHPAFSFGNTELNGLWFGKFETTGTILNPTILPEKNSIINIKVSEGFNISKTFQMNLNLSDSHLARGFEWGSAAYLTNSIYGINQEVRINNSNLTGCGALSHNESYNNVCSNKFLTMQAYPQSTTGNITGIFDMSGGNADLVFTALGSSAGIPRAGHDINSNSGYKGYLNNGSWYNEGQDLPDQKYFEVLANGTSCTTNSCKGLANSETSGWYDDYNLNYNPSYSWTTKGGNKSNKETAGIFSKTDYHTGGRGSNITFRIVVTEK